MNDKEKMQAEAVNQAREMYSRRSPPFPQSGYNPNVKYIQNNSQSQSKPKITAADTSGSGANQNMSNQKNDSADEKSDDSTISKTFRRKDPLESFFADKEKTLIILLIALLNEEKASSSLLLALMYLII